MKAPAPNFRRVQERHFSAHHTMLRIARIELDRAKRKEPGWFDSIFVVLTFSALAIEAIANAVGQRVIEDWKDFESASPNAKVRLLAERLEIEYSQKGAPWDTIRWLGRFRNSVAHAKPEHVIHDQLTTGMEEHQRATDSPKSKLERDVTIANAKRALDAVNLLKLMYCEKVSDEDRFGLDADGWSTSTGILRESQPVLQTNVYDEATGATHVEH